MSDENYIEVKRQQRLYKYFHIKGDDKNRYMSLDELQRYHPEANKYINDHRYELEEEFNNKNW